MKRIRPTRREMLAKQVANIEAARAARAAAAAPYTGLASPVFALITFLNIEKKLHVRITNKAHEAVASVTNRNLIAPLDRGAFLTQSMDRF